MKLRVENLTILLFISVMVLVGCTGDKQRKPEQAEQPADTQQEVPLAPDVQITEAVEKPDPVRKADTPQVSILGAKSPVDKVKADKLKALHETPGLSTAERRRQKVEILAEGLTDFEAGRILTEHTMQVDARPYLDKALAENPDDFDVMLFWAMYATPLNDESPPYADLFRKKISLLRHLVEINPEHTRALSRLASHLSDVYPQEALGYAKKAYQLSPSQNNHYVLAKCYYHAGEYEKALSAYKSIRDAMGVDWLGPLGNEVLYTLTELHEDEAYRERYRKSQKATHERNRKRFGLE